jgi:hypothetical protein
MTPEQKNQSLITSSSKMVFLDKLLAKLLNEGHKVNPLKISLKCLKPNFSYSFSPELFLGPDL